MVKKSKYEGPRPEIAGYKMGRGYNSVTVWHFDLENRELTGTSKRTSNKGGKATRYDKYKAMCEILLDCDIRIPKYKPTKREKDAWEKEKAQ